LFNEQRVKIVKQNQKDLQLILNSVQVNPDGKKQQLPPLFQSPFTRLNRPILQSKSLISQVIHAPKAPLINIKTTNFDYSRKKEQIKLGEV